MIKTTWLFSKKIDLLFLFIPVWIIWIWAFSISAEIQQITLPLWVWVVFILGLDVSHVWSTIYRSYTNTFDLKNHKKTLILVPIICLPLLIVLASYSHLIFWRILAYFALFHFVKQQYGFFAMYYSKQIIKKQKRFFTDKFSLYFGVLAPVVYWHLDSSRSFNWFVEGDFISVYNLLNNAYILEYLLIAIKVSFWLVLLGWLIEETIFIVKEKASIQWGKILWIITSSLNWFIGIVWINSDLVFSISNVVAHGLPYLVLVFYYKFKEFKIENIQLEMPSLFMKLFNMFLFILVLAIVEEYLWDLFVNREKQAFFEYIFDYSIAYIDDNNFQAVAIGVLSLPQVVHYVLDGFLWKMNKNNTRFKEIMKNE